MSSAGLKILVTPIEGGGHLNSCLALAEILRDRGHQITFALPDSSRNKAKALGFEEEWYNSELKIPPGQSPDVWVKIVSSIAPAFLQTPKEQIRSILLPFLRQAIQMTKDQEPLLRRIVEKVRPDLILVDLPLHQPAVMDAGIPWVFFFSALTPALISGLNVPPAHSGEPTGEENRGRWEEYYEEYKSVLHPLFLQHKEWLMDNGGPDFEFQQLFAKFSPYANVYTCPEEMDLTQFRDNPPNFFRFDPLVRRGGSAGSLQIPASLLAKPGKLVYLAVGTILSAELGMMRRLLAILAKSPHRFIVSKGPLGDELELPSNAWGLNNLPQVDVLPLVDLVITHGGYNTVKESLLFGKPLIVLPLFSDQLDNAQRVHEAGFGLRLPYKVEEARLLTAIETVLHEDYGERMAAIGARIQGQMDQTKLAVAELIEALVLNQPLRS